MKYVLITPAHNEEAFIEKTLASMVAQTMLPERWVIVDDGSTDKTAEIVENYTQRYPWIELVRRPEQSRRSFAGKVHAFNAGLERVQQSLEFEVIGNLDADLSFDPKYLEFLIGKFAQDPRLGVAGTPFTENGGYDTARDSFEGENHVAGGCQLFRRQCFTDVGGYIPNPAGGIDWIAVTTARMKGWRTRSFPQKRFHHYRTLGTAGKSGVAASFSYGEKDYYLGGSPIWQLFRVAYRARKQPIDGLALLSGYCWATIRRIERPVSRELMRFHRGEQLKKLNAILRALLKFKKVDSFHLLRGVKVIQWQKTEVTRQSTEDPPTSRGIRAWRARGPAPGLASGWKRETLSSGLEGRRARSGPGGSTEPEDQQVEMFFRQYTSQDAITKFTKTTAGFGIAYLLDHDYKSVYMSALNLLPQQTRERGIRMLEFGCGGGMHLIHIISVLSRGGINVDSAIGTDFSPVLIEAAVQEAKNYLPAEDRRKVQFCVARNETLIENLSSALGKERTELENSFHFILGVNTLRYCHAVNREPDCARNIFSLLVPGGMCVVIDMNNRFPFFLSDLKNRFRKQKEKQCYLPSLEEYAAPFFYAGFEVLRKEHFCWVPHSSRAALCRLVSGMSPLLDMLAKSRAMRSLVVSRKPR